MVFLMKFDWGQVTKKIEKCARPYFLQKNVHVPIFFITKLSKKAVSVAV